MSNYSTIINQPDRDTLIILKLICIYYCTSGNLPNSEIFTSILVFLVFKSKKNWASARVNIFTVANSSNSLGESFAFHTKNNFN